MPKKNTQTEFVKHPVSAPRVSDETDLLNPLMKHSLSEASRTVDSTTKPGSTETVRDEDWTIHKIIQGASGHSPETHQKILDYLTHLDLITKDQAKKVSSCVGQKDFDVVSCLLQNDLLKENEAGMALAAFFNVPFVSFNDIDIPQKALILIPKEVCIKKGVVAYGVTANTVKVAMVNPADKELARWIETKTGKKAELHYTTPQQVEAAAKRYPSEFESKLGALESIRELPSADNISQFFDSLVLLAYQRGASDVHIEPFEKEVRVRFRVDGVLHIITTLPKETQETAVNHIKVLAHLRIDAHNLAQDGRFKVTHEQVTINFRVSVMPTFHGEKVVLRLLTSEMQKMSIGDLGYVAADQALIEQGIAKTSGMILICGPTGSGKTTTLYALLKELNQEGVNISTIEDPIEYGLPGVVQIQVNPQTNISYAEGLKSMMRQDPDILMIGEIRDFETGKIAMNASLTGHLVLTTLHTNNASLAPLRLLQMGVDPYLVVTTVSLIVAQRLVRRICKSCVTSQTLSTKELEKIRSAIGLNDRQTALFKRIFEKKATGKVRLYKGAGCPQCGGTGYHGRTVIAESLKVNDQLRDLILASRPESEIEAVAEKNGMITLFEDGLRKVIQGVTTLDEVLRVINQ